MAYDSRETLATRLTEIRAEITKARKAQSYAVGSNELTLTRAALRQLLDEEQWVLSEIEKIDHLAAGTGTVNRIQFGRPT